VSLTNQGHLRIKTNAKYRASVFKQQPCTFCGINLADYLTNLNKDTKVSLLQMLSLGEMSPVITSY